MGSGPTALCIGAQKAGTTWLYRCLEDRQDVWLPPVKELHFFDEKDVSELSWFDHLHDPRAPSARWRRQIAAERQRRSRTDPRNLEEVDRRAWCSRYFFAQPSADWYRGLFPFGERATFDISPEYALLDHHRIERVLSVAPDIRVVYLLRNPIEREWSATQMRYRKNPTKGPETVLAGRHPHVRYCANIDRWSAVLPPGRLYVGWFDDIANNPAELLADLLKFVGADSTSVSLPEGRPNSGNVTTMPAHLAVQLARDLAGEIDALAARFGGPATDWADNAQVLRETSPEGDLAYPFRPPTENRHLSPISSVTI